MSAQRRIRRPIAAIGLAVVLACCACTQRPAPSTSRQDRTLASIADSCARDPRRAAGHALIKSDQRPQESLLWLRALAVSSVDGPPDGKLNQLLDCERLASGKCRYYLTQNSAEAVLVSRVGLDALRPVRGPLDVERLERYITWSARPETVTVRQTASNRLEIHADPGPGDVILFRRDFDHPWLVAPASIQLREDPLGYLVLEPRGHSGPVDIVLETDPLAGAPAEGPPVDAGEFPLIQAEGVVDGTTFAGPPFPAGSVLSIFGRRFGETGNQVRIGDSQVEILYESATQINVRLSDDLAPGVHDLTVITRGRSTEPYPIEVSR